MPKAKPVSLHPLTFDQAMAAILGAPAKTEPPKKKGTAKTQKRG
jgi:hypothetical protein